MSRVLVAFAIGCGGNVAPVLDASPPADECSCTAVAPSTARCVDGRCVVTLAASDRDPWGIVVDAEYVYWTDHSTGRLSKVPIAGGSSTTLAMGALYSLGMDADNLYWTRDRVMKIAKHGGSPIELAGTTHWGFGIAVTADSVFWVESYGGGSLDRVGLDGGPVTTLATKLPQPAYVVADGSNLYFTAYDGSVTEIPRGGGTAVTLATGPSDAAGIAVDRANVYWASYEGGTIQKVALSGGPPLTLASGENGPSALVVDDTFIYWAAGDFAIKKVPIAGGPITTLAKARAVALAVDGTSLYWTDFDGRSVMKVTPK